VAVTVWEYNAEMESTGRQEEEDKERKKERKELHTLYFRISNQG
jgi:hypothetical protein